MVEIIIDILLVFSTLSSILLFVFIIYNKQKIKSDFLALLAIAISFYMVGYYIEITNVYLETSNVGLKIRYIGLPFIPTLWYLCVREFCGLSFKNNYQFIGMAIVPTIIALLAFTWESNSLLFHGVEFFSAVTPASLKVLPGPLYMYSLIYQYAINLLGILTLIFCYRKGTRHFRKQAVLFLISALIPFFNITTYIVTLDQHNIDVTAYGMVMSLLLFVYALYIYGVWNLSDIIKDNAMNNLFEGVLLFDREGIFMDANNSAIKIFPQLVKVPLGTHIDEMDYLPFDLLTLSCDGNTTGCVREFVLGIGSEEETFSISISHVSVNGKLIGYSVILKNISPMKKLLGELHEKAVKDPLTGLFNRGYLFAKGEEWIASIRLSDAAFSAIMFDLDHFKRVNDTYGHACGDYVLKTVSSICASNLRETDIIARYGGEEFCVLLYNSNADLAYKKAEFLRERIAKHLFEYEGHKFNLTASFGVAAYGASRKKEKMDFATLLKQADENLYKAKETGRNKVC